MWKFLSVLQKNMVVTVPLFMAGGFLAGLLLDDPSFLKAAILPLTFLMVFPMMVTMQFKKIFETGDSRLQIVTQMINFLLIPFAGWFIGRIFFGSQPWFALGFLLVSLLPTSGMTISWTGMSKGNMEGAVKMTVIGLLAGSLLAPLYIKVLMGAELSIPVTKIFSQIAVIVLLPMILGSITQTLIIRAKGRQEWQMNIKKKFPPLSTLGVLGIVFTAMALKAESIVRDPAAFLSLIPPLLILYSLNIIVSTWTAKRFFSREDGLALVYGTVLRNLSIALAIAMTSFGSEGSAIALIIALGYIVQIQLSAWYVRLADRIFGPPVSEAQAA
ncbi:MAG: bile acid:sodium symporter [Spirochaetales bacterium]|nr:bile acid:sodium symporter [Spirochaetales bacterium]